MFTDKKIAFIGSGTMAEAMIRGLLTNEILGPEQIIASGPRVDRGVRLKERYKTLLVLEATDNRDVAAKAKALLDRATAKLPKK